MGSYDSRSDRMRAGDRFKTLRPSTSSRLPSGTDERTPEVEANCEMIADYLLELARQGQIEPALSAILDALDEGMERIEDEAHHEADKIYDAIFRNHIDLQERRLRRQGVDPYFWG